MTYTYKPSGVCSKKIQVELEGDIIKHVTVTGGCSGNSQGVSRLVEGMNVHDTIERLKGVRCGLKPTSCPDQISVALRLALREEKGA